MPLRVERAREERCVKKSREILRFGLGVRGYPLVAPCPPVASNGSPTNAVGTRSTGSTVLSERGRAERQGNFHFATFLFTTGGRSRHFLSFSGG